MAETGRLAARTAPDRLLAGAVPETTPPMEPKKSPRRRSKVRVAYPTSTLTLISSGRPKPDSSSHLADCDPRPVAFVNGFQNATLVAAIIAVAGAVVAATTLQHARHREPAREVFPEAA